MGLSVSFLRRIEPRAVAILPFHETITLLSFITDLIPAALSAWLFAENRKLKRLGREKELHLKQIERDFLLGKPAYDNFYRCGSVLSAEEEEEARKIDERRMSHEEREKFRKINKLNAEISYLEKQLGKSWHPYRP